MNIAEIEALRGKSTEWCTHPTDPLQYGVYVARNGRCLVSKVTANRDERELLAAAPVLADELIAVKKLLGRAASRLREIETSYGTLIDEAEKAAK